MTNFEWFIMGAINGFFGCSFAILCYLYREERNFQKWMKKKKEEEELAIQAARLDKNTEA